MSLLFRKSRNIHSFQSRVVKNQAGGKVDVYGSYQVREDKTQPFNPIALLSKYKSIGPGEKTGKEKDPAKPKDVDVKLAGLPNDNAVAAQKLARLDSETLNLVSTLGDKAYDTDGYRVLSQAYNQVSRELVDHAYRLKIHDIGKADMKANQTQDNWFFTGKEGMVKTTDPVTGTSTYAMLPPEVANTETNPDGSRKWEIVTYQEAATQLANNPMFAEQMDLTQNLSTGKGIPLIKKDLDTMYSSIANLKEAWSSATGGFQNGSQIIKEIARGGTKASNHNQLNQAFQNIGISLRNSPGWNSLLAAAWREGIYDEEAKTYRPVQTYDEALMNVNKFLANDLKSRLNIETDTESRQFIDAKATENLNGGSGAGGPAHIMSKYIYPWALVEAKPTQIEVPQYDSTKKQMINNKTTIINVLASQDPESEADIKREATNFKVNNKKAMTLAGVQDLNKLADIQGSAQLADGTKISTVKNETDSNFSGKVTVTGLNSFTLAANPNVRVTVLPMKNGAVFAPAMAASEAYNKKIESIEKRRKANKNNLGHINTQLDKEEEKAKADFKKEFKGVFLQKFYLVDTITHKTTVNSDYIKAHGKKPDASEVADWQDANKDFINETSDWFTTNDQTDQEHFTKVTIMIKARPSSQIQQADPKAHLYIFRNQSMSGDFGAAPGNSPVSMEVNDKIPRNAFIDHYITNQ